MDSVLNVGGGEILVIFIAALVILGPERLPKFANDVGKWLTKLRTMSTGVQAEFRDALAADDFKESLDGVRAVMDLKNQIVGELTGISTAVTSSVNASVNEVKSTTGGSFYTAPTEWPEPVVDSNEADSATSDSEDTSESETDSEFTSQAFAGAFDPGSLDEPEVSVETTGAVTPAIAPPDGVFADDVPVDHPMNHQSAGTIASPSLSMPDILLSERVFPGASQ
jgi:sec-independent protein translocase protein TatB